jgi:polyhydroxyalkanoate synthase
MLDPMGNWGKFIALDEAAQRPDQLARALARERWLEENVPMPGTFAREFIRRAYQEDALLAGTWAVDDETVDLRNWTGPLLVVAARKDFIAPLEAVAPLASATGSTDATLEVLETGHIGIVVGTFGPRVFFPLLDRWFRARAGLARAGEAGA